MKPHWHDWDEAAFSRARAEGRPVFVLIFASWCRFCAQLEREVLADPRIERLLAAHFVCVRVDKDRRPDLDARHSAGGWPSLLYLDESGERLAGDLYLDVDELAARLELV